MLLIPVTTPAWIVCLLDCFVCNRRAVLFVHFCDRTTLGVCDNSCTVLLYFSKCIKQTGVTLQKVVWPRAMYCFHCIVFPSCNCYTYSEIVSCFSVALWWVRLISSTWTEWRLFYYCTNVDMKIKAFQAASPNELNSETTHNWEHSVCRDIV